MLDAQRHRGPDDWGLLVPASPEFTAITKDLDPDRVSRYAGDGPGVTLGSRRLAIVDLSARGRMPMGDGEGRAWISHNGEIYNHPDLRAVLAAQGVRFRSATDTEAILEGYRVWGDGVIQRLRGMFAFAVFEARPRPRLLLARDRFGIKPMYYYRDRERLVFASEVRALLRSGLLPDEPNADALTRFLQWGSVPSPLTTVKDVFSLPAGHCLAVEAGGPALRRYWDIADVIGDRLTAAGGVDPDEAAVRSRALLEDSVRSHLVSDVPLGVFLSGGIDSSALVALARGARDVSLTTLNVVFDERTHSEAAHARLVATRHRTDHREITVRARDFFDALPRYFQAMDEPTVDGVNTYLVSEAARRAGLTVVLSGTGGDEVFLGYRHLRTGAWLDGVWRGLRVMPAATRRALIGVATMSGPALGRPGADRLEYLRRPDPATLYLTVRGLFGPSEIRALLGSSGIDEEPPGVARPDPRVPRPDGVAGVFETLEFSHYLQNQLLKDADVMGMAHSVEIRVPYLDHGLVEYVVGLPRRTRLAGGAHKPLLVRALGDALPRQVWDRPKKGFTLPFGSWLTERAGELEAVSHEGKLAQRDAVEKVWRGFRAGRVHWSRAWALVVLSRFEAARKEGRAA